MAELQKERQVRESAEFYKAELGEAEEAKKMSIKDYFSCSA